jgi:hypothetical protein
VFLRVRSPSSVNCKLKCSPAKSTEHGDTQGPFINTVRTPTDKSVWGIILWCRICLFFQKWNHLLCLCLFVLSGMPMQCIHGHSVCIRVYIYKCIHVYVLAPTIKWPQKCGMTMGFLLWPITSHVSDMKIWLIPDMNYPANWSRISAWKVMFVTHLVFV